MVPMNVVNATLVASEVSHHYSFGLINPFSRFCVQDSLSLSLSVHEVSGNSVAKSFKSSVHFSFLRSNGIIVCFHWLHSFWDESVIIAVFFHVSISWFAQLSLCISCLLSSFLFILPESLICFSISISPSLSYELWFATAVGSTCRLEDFVTSSFSSWHLPNAVKESWNFASSSVWECFHDKWQSLRCWFQYASHCTCNSDFGSLEWA